MDIEKDEYLYDAVVNEDINAIYLLLDEGANPNKTCSQGKTSLGMAAFCGNLNLLKALLAYSSPPTNASWNNSEIPINRQRDSSHACERPRKYKNSSDNKSQGNTVNTADVSCAFPTSQNNNRNSGYFVIVHEDDSPGNSDCSKKNLHCTPLAPSSPNTPSELEWDEEDGNVAPSTTEDETWALIYRWYAIVLESTGTVLAQASASTCGIDQQDAYLRAAVHYAAEQGHLEALQMLLEAGCNVDVCAGDDLTPLLLAVLINRPDIVCLLLKFGAKVNRATLNGDSPLHVAASRGLLEVVDLLIEAGAVLEARDSHDCCPLFLAASHGHALVVKRLINAGANVNAEDISGVTALCTAVWNEDCDLVDLLLSSRARVNHSHRLLHHAVKHNKETIVTHLCKAGGLNIHDENGDPPLLLAVRNRKIQIMETLLGYGALVNSTNSITGASALHVAVESVDDPQDFEAIVECLACHGINIDATALTGDTALQRAILVGNNMAVILLVRYGADVSSSHLPMSPKSNFILTNQYQSPNITRFLIKAGHVMPAPGVMEYYRSLVPDLAVAWLIAACRQPLTLSDICRIHLRKFRRNKRLTIRSYIEELPLPRALKMFLNLEDEDYVGNCSFTTAEV